MAKDEPQRTGRIRAMRMLIDKGAQRYDGNRHLDRLLGGHSEIWGGPAGDPTVVIAKLKRALRSQRRLGRAGHWSYDLNRHLGILQALKAELARARQRAQPTAAGANLPGSTTPEISDTGTDTS